MSTVAYPLTDSSGPIMSSVLDPHPVPAIVVPGPTTATSHTSASTTSQTANSAVHSLLDSHRRGGLGLSFQTYCLSCRMARRHKRDSSHDIITHWLPGDPARGLYVPLKDWPPTGTRVATTPSPPSMASAQWSHSSSLRCE